MIKIQGTKQKQETLGLIAQAWKDAPVGAVIEITQPNDLGGKSLEKTLLSHFKNSENQNKNKSRIITIVKTDKDPDVIAEWLQYRELRLVEETGFFSVPGLFGWNKIDAGSSLLVDTLPKLNGIGTDFGCGYGYLSRSVLLDNTDIQTLYCFDYDLMSVEACRQNISDPRAIIGQTDCSKVIQGLPPLDFIIMNPPFHDGTEEDRNLGVRFIETAAHHLKSGGVLWVVANTHLPYEKPLKHAFRSVEKMVERNGFKVFQALK